MLLVKTCFLLFHSSGIQVGTLPKCETPFCAMEKSAAPAMLSLRASHRTGKRGRLSRRGDGERAARRTRAGTALPSAVTAGTGLCWERGEVWSGAGECGLLCSSASGDAGGC